MPKRLAITVSGAVSLGTYEAGVLYEVIYAIGQHNQNPQTIDDERIYVDVLTGASAGGMSVAVAAQKLLYDAPSLDDPYNNALYQAWVQDIDIASLLTLGKDEPSDCSIFSSDRISKLANEFICGRYGTGRMPQPKTHAAISPERTLKLGLALSNLNGIDYGRQTLANGEFIYSRFQDEFRRTLTLADDNEAAWRPIAEAAVACGAFPIAFRTQDLQRLRSEFNDADIVEENLGPDPLTFTYTDGGVFQNEPLGLAKNFVDEIDRHLGADSRAYLFVSPDTKLSRADRKFSATQANYWTMLGKLARAILYESRFQDWIRAEQVNEQVDLFNRRAQQLHALLESGTLNANALGPVSSVLLKQFFPADSDLQAARTQLRQQFAAEYADLECSNPETADAWIDAILLLEMASGLHGKDEMYIYTLTASAQELAGAQLMAFLGFLDQTFRQHDYDIGRTKAQELLTRGVTQLKGPLPVLRYTPQPVRPINAKLAGARITDAPLETRKALRQRLRDRVDIVLKEAGLAYPMRRAVELLYANRKVNEFLGL
jgi:hypothetical protein